MAEADLSDGVAPATAFAVDLLSAFVARGLRHVVLSPGSRSQALALVAAELERVGALELHVRIDERVAGFTALGIAVESGLPAVVVTTSGTAPAHLHPAVLEADAAGVPLIVVSADRPSELRGIRANQTTVQPGLFARAVRFEADVPAAPAGVDADRLAGEAWDAALGTSRGTPGPVHLNVAFRSPLSSAVPDLGSVGPAASIDPTHAASGMLALERGVLELEPGGATVVIAGADAGPRAEELARDGEWPLVAEVSSGARFGPQLVPAYRRMLADPAFGGGLRRAIVFGHPTLSREVHALLERADIETVVVAPTGAEVFDPGHDAVVAADVLATPYPEGRRETRRWVITGRALQEEGADEAPGHDEPGEVAPSPRERAAYARDELGAVRRPVTRRMLAEALWQHTWPHDRLVLGASRLIREVDREVGGKRIRVHANRGLAGIDGTIATATGIALARSLDEGGTVRVLLGDLTLLHDVGALLFGIGERRPRLQVVVGDDGGGTIFDSLEVAQTTDPTEFDRVLYTPQPVDLEALARAYGWDYARAETWGELERGLTAAVDGPALLHVPLPR